tara:strand:+ start:107 stop:358 length:252 start_codon:yes stop_codon:yes gene_type:complete
LVLGLDGEFISNNQQRSEMVNKKQLGLVVVGLRDLKKKNLWHKDLDLFDLLEAGLKADAIKQITKAKARWKKITDKEDNFVRV